MAEIEFLPLPPRTTSSESPRSERVDSVQTIREEAAPSPPAASFTTGQTQTHFRPLTADEIEREVLPDYARTGNPPPDPAISTIIGAFAGDRVLGYLVLQLKLHAQPLVLRPGHSNVLSGLVSAAESHILATAGPQWVYLFSPAGRLATIAQSMGMQLEPWVVLSKLVQPTLPEQSPLEIVPGEPDILPAQIPITTEELDDYPGTDYQERPDEAAWDSLFPNGVLGIDPTGRVQ